MRDSSPQQVTLILEAINAGDAAAEDQLLPLVYDELRKIARSRMARERPGQTLQPTALVHEAYLRLFGGEKPSWESRAHFFGAAGEAMRRILIERARKKGRLMRGGDRRRVELDTSAGRTEPPSDEVLALDESLSELESIDSKMAQVVKLRYFAGLTVEETASAMASSPRTVHRQSVAARAWLQSKLYPSDQQGQ